MKKVFFDAIREGRKTMTLRYWKGQRLRAGQIHTISGLGKVRIESVRPVELSELTDADAAADGFESVARMREALAAIYPGLSRLPRAKSRGASSRGLEQAAAADDGRRVYAVHFTFLGERA